MADSKITFKDIEEANKGIRTMPIERYDKKKGQTVSKDYAEVNQRIKAFRKLYPEGYINTRIISHESGIIVMRAEVGYYTEEGTAVLLGCGTAFENQKNGMINGTSYIENCETSAVGRALGMCGIGIDVSVASYEEVSNAIAQQNAPAPAVTSTPKVAAKKQYICENCEKPVTDAEGLTVEQIVKVSNRQFHGHIFCVPCAHAISAELKKKEEAEAVPVEDDPALQLPFPIDD